MAYPVSVDVPTLVAGRNRLTTAFRLILAIPHLILVGGVGMGIGTASGGDNRSTVGSETGLLGAVAAFLAVVSWFTIVFTDATSRGFGSSRRSICDGASARSPI